MPMLSEILTPQSLCLLMVLTTFGLYYTRFPMVFTIAGTAVIFAIISILAGFIKPDFLQTIPEQFYAIMTNKTLLAIPPLIFMYLLLEKIQYSKTLISDLGTLKKFQSNSIAIQTCLPLIAFLLAASSGVVIGVLTGILAGGLAGGLALVLSSWSKEKIEKSDNLPASSASSTTHHAAHLSNQTASTALSYLIAPSLILILLGDQINSGLSVFREGQGAAGLNLTELFISALALALLLLAFYLAYHILKNSIARKKAARVNNQTVEETEPTVTNISDSESTSSIDDAGQQSNAPLIRRSFSERRNESTEILTILIVPILFTVTLLGLISTGFADLSEVAAIGALAALMRTATRLNPALRKLSIAVIISFFLLILLKVNFELKITTLQTNLYEAAALFLSFVLIAIIALGIWKFCKTCFLYQRDDDTYPMTEVIQQTLLHSSMIFVLLLSSSVFLLMIKGLETGPAMNAWLLAVPGGTPFAILAALLMMLLLAVLLPHLLVVSLFVPIITPELMKLSFSTGEQVNVLWLALLMIMTLQLAYMLTNENAMAQEIQKRKTKEPTEELITEPQVTKTIKLKSLWPYLIIHMIVMTALWYSPVLIPLLGQ